MKMLAEVARMADVEARVELAWLMDFYAPLLTPHRREILRLYCEEDLSLAEIAAQMQITRQGVSDALKKGRAQLTDYEDKMGLAARYRALSQQAQDCMAALSHLNLAGEAGEHLKRARQALERIINEG